MENLESVMVAACIVIFISAIAGSICFSNYLSFQLEKACLEKNTAEQCKEFRIGR